MATSLAASLGQISADGQPGEHQSQHDPQLMPADAAALDALIGSGLDAAAAQTDSPDPRIRQLEALLGSLEGQDTQDRSLMADVILLRIARHEAKAAALAQAPHELTNSDKDAIDALLLGRWRDASVPKSLRDRAIRAVGLLSVLDDPQTHGRTSAPVSSTSESHEPAGVTLADRTLHMVAAYESEQRERMSLRSRVAGIDGGTADHAVAAGGARFRWADLGAVAAVLVVAYSLLTPAVNATRQYAHQAACAATLGGIGQAMASYGQANADSLPLASSSFDQTWWGVGRGQARSNSANMFVLKPTGYLSVAEMACPGNEHAARTDAEVADTDWRNLKQVSFSYRLPIERRGRLTMRFQDPSALSPSARVITADRSPVILQAFAGQHIDPFASSPNHAGVDPAVSSQTVLFGDGATRRLSSPVMANGDNIWLPRSLETVIRELAKRSGRPLRGRELPGDADDAFLGP